MCLLLLIILKMCSTYRKTMAYWSLTRTAQLTRSQDRFLGLCTYRTNPNCRPRVPVLTHGLFQARRLYRQASRCPRSSPRTSHIMTSCSHQLPCLGRCRPLRARARLDTTCASPRLLHLRPRSLPRQPRTWLQTDLRCARRALLLHLARAADPLWQVQALVQRLLHMR